jgi:hypothetical protein
MNLDVFLALILRVATGILAVQDPYAPVKAEEAMSWATAAVYHAKASDLDPYLLIGIARNESDFKPNTVGPDGLDCGLTQTRVTYSKYKCNQLKKDYWIAFEEAARELREFRTICKKRNPHDMERCMINSYNQGPRYFRSGWHGAYYLRTLCFTEAARAGVTPKRNCRSVKSKWDIAQIIKQSTPVRQIADLKAGTVPTKR